MAGVNPKFGNCIVLSGDINYRCQQVASHKVHTHKTCLEIFMVLYEKLLVGESCLSNILVCFRRQNPLTTGPPLSDTLPQDAD